MHKRLFNRKNNQTIPNKAVKASLTFGKLTNILFLIEK